MGGLIEDIIKTKVIGSEVRRGIEKIKEKGRKGLFCGYCGKKLSSNDKGAKCSEHCGEINQWTNNVVSPTLLCKKCMKKCKRCGRYVCPDHYHKNICYSCFKEENGFFSRWPKKVSTIKVV